jgi:hypothetical protein
VDILFLNVAARNGHEGGGKMAGYGGRRESEWSIGGKGEIVDSRWLY